MRRIDFSGNRIEEIEDGAFSKLLLLEELSLAENRLVKLPVLPPKLTTFNANQNRIKSRGIKANAFKVRKNPIISVAKVNKISNQTIQSATKLFFCFVT